MFLDPFFSVVEKYNRAYTVGSVRPCENSILAGQLEFCSVRSYFFETWD